jgi:hypothetical protein
VFTEISHLALVGAFEESALSSPAPTILKETDVNPGFTRNLAYTNRGD